MRYTLTRSICLALALGASGLTVPLQAAVAADGAPVAFTGVLPANISDVSDLVIALDPDPSHLDGLDAGDKMSLYTLPASDVSPGPDSSYSVTLDPAAIPAAYISGAGVVTFELFGIDDAGTHEDTSTLSVRAVSVDDGTTRWVDASQTAAAADDEADARTGSVRGALPRLTARAATHLKRVHAPKLTTVRLNRHSIRAVRALRALHAREDVDPRPVCGTVATGSTSDRQATIGTTYPAGSSTAKMKVSQSAGATYGVAVNGSASGTNWSASGSAYAKGGTDQAWSFTWDASEKNRSYRDVIRYGKYHYVCLGASTYKWSPMYETGGVDDVEGIDKPSWSQCTTVDKGTWTMDSGSHTDYGLATSVKFAGAIGTDLSIDRAYSQHSEISYSIKEKGHVLCGSDNQVPARAGKVLDKKG